VVKFLGFADEMLLCHSIVNMLVPQIHLLMLTVCALYLYYYCYYYYISISALTLLVGQREGHMACKNYVGLLVVTI